jgi:DNA-binding GntR family transcriptional regulator
MQFESIPSLNLSDRIRSIVRERIVQGTLAPASRINEVHMAEALRVSRTPLREALNGLVAEGALRSVPRRGFFVRPLSVEEFLAIYPIRALLDPEALRLSGIPSPQRIRELERLNRQLRAEPDCEQRVRLDDQWHLELVSGCPNPVLLDLIRQFMMRTRRYELAFYRATPNLETSTADHQRVIAAARRNDMQGALQALRNNMTSGIDPIVAWLRERDDTARTGPGRTER